MANSRTALIIGASRGLGLGLVQRLHEDGWKITATVRNPQQPGALANVPGVHIEQLEMNDTVQLDGLKQRLQGQVFDLIFVNAGVMGPLPQDLEAVSNSDIGDLFMTNAVAPIRVARRLVDQIREGSGVLAFMSSILGSITIPDGGEICLYKASKAALNSMINSFFVEQQRPDLCVLAMHPGWVKTDMGGENADIDVLTSTRGMIEQIKAQSGKGGLRFINYKGEPLVW
ncbi:MULTISPECIES: SDR family oxidoreductase [Pseudomonas]|uniref:SDR family oxidoreductase n=1 Tax=Pseudomonas TaxID=286 RepID=UPI00159DB9C0|nr:MULTISPECIES: SDR family oxidoreductase [Pseudomonas]WHH50807.1 SDR family oxidoreductase [Pseudomonas sp. Ap32]MBP2273514.1 NAD(P)-dependent dehydrogenase (short-subunit alcohol dehydrogenase family) [Pseudomonas sp. BP6]MBP2287515.1 NAD(P)-dependent dehydrogenase (short-subunit alcohol dehydrogenase family) [Pseudomonas sp. BP7]NVN64348.1 SDR family oxidoreductase [Pseudomonas putida]NVN69647.1 SDR family oxidoreductase [Pseudomonas putida]